MKNRIVSLAAAALLAGCVTGGEYNRVKDELRDVGRENADLNNRLASLSDELSRERALREQETEALRSQLELAQVDKAETAKELQQRVQEKEVEIAKKSDTFDRIQQELRKEIAAGKIDVTEVAGKLRVRMADRILFPSGSADLSQEGKGVLRRLAQTLKEVTDKLVQVEGHTDDRPIKTARFPSNWELSAGRASTVVRYLAEQGLDQKRLAATGFGEFQPVGSNKTAEGRQSNRRIEIVLVPLDLERALAEATRRKERGLAPDPSLPPAP